MNPEYLNSKIVGKTVSTIVEDDSVVTLTFTDGTVLELKVRGTEEQWIEIEMS